MARKKAAVDHLDVTALTVTRPQLARLFGVSERTLSSWTAEGMPQQARGCFQLVPCLRWLEARIQRKGDDRDGGLADTKIKLFDAQRKHADLAMEQKRGKLLDADETAAALTDIYAILDRHLMALPAKLAATLTGKHDPTSMARAILLEARQTRRRMAEDVQAFAQGLADGDA
jgi:hypothetical protein